MPHRPLLASRLVVCCYRSSRLRGSAMPPRAQAQQRATVATETGPPPARVLLWFRNDLRLHDNECLSAAVAAARGAPLLSVYFLDPRHFGTTKQGHRKTGVIRAAFLLAALDDLRKSLRARGSGLLVVRGKPEDAIRSLCDGRTLVFAQAEAASEELGVEKRVAASVATAGGTLRLCVPPSRDSRVVAALKPLHTGCGARRCSTSTTCRTTQRRRSPPCSRPSEGALQPAASRCLAFPFGAKTSNC